MISYRGGSLGEAADKLDDVLMRARERTDVETESIELRTPVSAAPVSLPEIERAAPARTRPAPMRERDGA